MRYVDGLRAVAALMVIACHGIGVFAAVPSPGFTSRVALVIASHGYLGVEIFFVLSGFVIAYTLRDADVTPSYCARFLFRRAIRLDPPYWASIIASIFIIWWRRRNSSEIVELPKLPQIAAHLFYVQSILRFEQINVIFWTLCFEVQFYIGFCLLLGLLQHVPRLFGESLSMRASVVFVFLFIFSLAWPTGILNSQTVYMWLLPCAYAFLAGVLAWRFVDRHLSGGAMILCALAIWIAAIALRNAQVLAVALTSTSLVVSACTGGLYSWLGAAPLQFIGKISYCVYLLHVAVIAFLLSAQKRLGLTSDFDAIVVMIAVFVFTLVAAFLLHVVVEAPCLRVSRRLKARQKITIEDRPIPHVAARAIGTLNS